MAKLMTLKWVGLHEAFTIKDMGVLGRAEFTLNLGWLTVGSLNYRPCCLGVLLVAWRQRWHLTAGGRTFFRYCLLASFGLSPR